MWKGRGEDHNGMGEWKGIVYRKARLNKKGKIKGARGRGGKGVISASVQRLHLLRDRERERVIERRIEKDKKKEIEK